MSRFHWLGGAIAASLIGIAGASPLSAAEPASNAVYDATCGLCHQARGAGLKGQFPKLAGRVDRMAADPEARVYLIRTILHGLAGKIEVDGTTVVGVMPSFETLSDADIASVLNYLVALERSPGLKVKAISAKEVAAARAGARIPMQELLAQRATLVASGKVP
jgi:mono/diheme cytochrome c family protein